MSKLNRSDYRIRFFRGVAANIEHNSGATGEPLYATDTGEVYIHNGTKFVPIITNRTPSSATDTGIKGQVAWDSSYIYVCVSDDAWKRTALSSW